MLGFLQSRVCVKAFLPGLVVLLLRVLRGLLGGFLFRRRSLAAALLLYRLFDGLLLRGLLDGLLFLLGGVGSLAGGLQFGFYSFSFIKNTTLFFRSFIIFRF